ncbi:MAG: hypothetical protein ABWY05_04215 [Noviherbaspirillum sp.]
MDQTVIGVFDTYDHADAARQQLIERGFAANDVQVRAHGADLEAASAAPGARTGDADTGFMESVRNFFADLFGPDMDDAGHYAEAVRRGGAVVAVTVASDDKVANAREALAAAGAFDIEKRVAEWRQSGYEGYRSDAAIYTTEEISTERARMNRESADMAARAPDSGTVRVVSRSAPGVSGSMMGTTADNMAATATSADYDDEFRSDWNTRYASTGGSYDDYAPAYRYGSTLGADSRYRDRPWDDIEPAARGDWQSRYPDSTWENFKDAVRYGWERVTGQR